MPVNFKFAVFEISGKPVLVDRKKIDETSKELKDGLAKVTTLTEAMLTAGFGLETPEGMNPVVLGNVDKFTGWVAEKLDVKNDDGTAFKLEKAIEKLPKPFSTVVAKLTSIDIKLYSAALFYAPDAPTRKLYGELVIGFEVKLSDPGFPLALDEIVISINNFVTPK
ncbi:MAG TPA: hypothetical protein VJM50_09635 [Pyrinomonadaceae bacterium]|nr:hypothetical protein [Pyrinomonadaceae bacterium]